MEPIQIFEPKFRKEEIIAQITECLDKGWTGLGYKTVEFEKAWSDYTGLEYSHFLSSNTVGLHLALNILKSEGGWKDGDEVLTTPITFVSTNHAILYENLSPVFCDVDEYLCLDPVDLESKITGKTRAVMFVGIGGNPGRLKEIKEICDKYNLKLILDAAHMSGTFVNGDSGPIHVGHEADVTVFSFQAVKNLPTADSGMICFRKAEYLEKARKLSWLGIDKDTFSRVGEKGSYKWKYDVPSLGFKYHGNSIMASMGLVQLKYLDDDNNYRNKLSTYYNKSLSKLNKLTIIEMSDYCYKSSRHLFQIMLDKNFSRDKLIEFLHLNKIFPGVHYRDNTKYALYSSANGNCPRAHEYSERILSLPLHLNLLREDIDRIVSVINKFLKD